MTLGRSLAVGTTGFALASLAVFGFWAVAGRVMYRTLGEAGFYAVCAVLFILIGSALLRPLTRLSFGRFALLFGGAFAAYALCWCLAWFLMRGKARESVGSLAGSVALCVVLCAMFSNWRAFTVSAVVVFVAHSAGYFLGSYVYDLLAGHRFSSKLGWGLFYGLGTGAGLGFAFWKAQSKPLHNNVGTATHGELR
jgi:hypothetical protein